jgi:hypothetical protein
LGNPRLSAIIVLNCLTELLTSGFNVHVSCHLYYPVIVIVH